MDLILYDCPHCKTQGVLPMSDGRCPHCKRELVEVQRTITLDNTAIVENNPDRAILDNDVDTGRSGTYSDALLAQDVLQEPDKVTTTATEYDSENRDLGSAPAYSTSDCVEAVSAEIGQKKDMIFVRNKALSCIICLLLILVGIWLFVQAHRTEKEVISKTVFQDARGQWRMREFTLRDEEALNKDWEVVYETYSKDPGFKESHNDRRSSLTARRNRVTYFNLAGFFCAILVIFLIRFIVEPKTQSSQKGNTLSLEL